MSSFTELDLIHLKPAHNRQQGFYTIHPFSYHIGTYPSREIITEPAGFYTDGISVRASMSWVIKRWGQGLAAGILHDFLYIHKVYNRKRSDRIFLEALKVLGISRWRRWTCYVCLRAFGGFAWRMKRD